VHGTPFLFSLQKGRNGTQNDIPVEEPCMGLLNRPWPEVVQLIIIIVISLTVHEYAHSLAAIRLGDDTPRRLTWTPSVSSCSSWRDSGGRSL
jgi:hypothetical protein